MAQLVVYVCFLALFSVNNYNNPQTYQLYNTKSIVADSFSGGLRPLDSVRDIAGIYAFLENTLVPSVAARNMTKLDVRCTVDGKHMNPKCLGNPFENEALCCYTKQPNRGIFSPGSHTKNLLVTNVRIRQQRVRAVTSERSPLGASMMRWPALSAQNEETRNGGGTVLDHDAAGDFLVCVCVCVGVCVLRVCVCVCLEYV